MELELHQKISPKLSQKSIKLTAISTENMKEPALVYR